MTTQTTLELIESAITSIEDGWAKSALETLKEAQMQEKAREQLFNAGVAPESMKYLVEALERIADPRNTHFAGDAQVVARAAIGKATGEQA